MLDFVTMIIYVNDDTRSSVGNEIYVPCSSPISTIRIFDIVVSILVPPPFLYYDLFHETHAEAYSRLFHDHLKYISSSSSFEKKFGKLINQFFFKPKESTLEIKKVRQFFITIIRDKVYSRRGKSCAIYIQGKKKRF